MADLYVKPGMKGVNISFTLQEYDGTAKNLSTFDSVVFRAWNPRNIVRATGACVVTNAAGGLAYYTIQAGDFPVSREDLSCEMQYLVGSTIVDKSQNYTIQVQESP